MPSIGNGYVSSFIGATQVYVAGLFNGFLTVGPSHRAVIPSPLNYVLSLNGSGTLSSTGYLLDVERAVYSQFSEVVATTGAVLASVEQSWFAHRANRSLVVHQIDVDNSKNVATLELKVNNGLKNISSPDVRFFSTKQDGFLLYAGSTIQSETLQGPRFTIAVCTTDLSAETGASSLSVPAGQTKSFYFVSVFSTDLPDDTKFPAETVVALYHHFTKEASDLMDTHVATWAKEWSNSGIEIEGDADSLRLQQVTNTSLYWMFSSIRSDWPWSLSPGSLASNGYNGHAFWDCETWMYPPIMMLDTNLGKSLLQYRANHLEGAKRNAKSYNPPYEGAMFPWEDAFSGQETCPRSADTGRYEQHITGDIAFAFRQFWDNTHDTAWLQRSYPILVQICTFWASRGKSIPPSFLLQPLTLFQSNRMALTMSLTTSFLLMSTTQEWTTAFIRMWCVSNCLWLKLRK